MSHCPLCQTNSIQELKWSEPYSIHRCLGCQSLFSVPMPSDEQLADFYQGFLYRKPDPKRMQALASKKAKEISRYLNPSTTRKKFLDFGGGTGVATLAADQLDLETHYYEIDLKAHDFVLENTNVQTDNTYVDQDKIPQNYFDLIWCDNVIEHVPEPQQFLDEIVKYLAPGGKLVIKTPNCRNRELLFFPLISVLGYGNRARLFDGKFSALLKTYASRIWCCDPPRHLFSFSTQGILGLCNSIPNIRPEAFYYRLPPWEYLLLPKLVSRSNFCKPLWFVQAFLGMLELIAKPLYFLYRPFLGDQAAGLGLVVERLSDDQQVTSGNSN